MPTLPKRLDLARRGGDCIGSKRQSASASIFRQRSNGTGVIKRGIDLLRRPELNKSIAFTV